jgi:pimeloyl-ACP methyl ester carboxylesterase
MSRRAVAACCVAVVASVAACSPSSGPERVGEQPLDGSTTTVTSTTPAPDTAATVPGITGTTTEAAPTSSLPPFEPGTIEWEPLNDAIDVGTLDVPVDYADPTGAQFELFLTRYNALDQANKIGTLLVNPGGPGFGGSEMALTAASRFDRALRERFDIVGWDPRGTGESDPAVDCIDDYDTYFTAVDNTPADAAAKQALVGLAEQFAAGCTERSGDILQHVGTNSSARDIDTIRRSLGEDQISFFGFSYGSELGGVWATMFPHTVRAAVFDGAADPSAPAEQSTLQQIAGFQASLDRFLAECSADEACPFHNGGDAESAFDALMASLDVAPIVGAPDRPPVNRDVATGAVVLAMYSDSFWPSLATSLAAAQAGDGSGLMALWDNYYRRQPDATWGNQLEAFQAITCADSAERLTVEASDARIAAQHAAGPRIVAADEAGSYTCTFFPAAVDPISPITAEGTGPIVVIGTTGDPSTPLESTQAMADALADGRLVVVDANQHTGYGVNRCVVDAVNAYLIDLAPPDDGTRCD